MNKPSIAVLVPDGVGVRNFVLGRFLSEMARSFEPHVFHNIPERLLEHYTAPHGPAVTWRPMVPYLQARVPMVLQYTLEYAHMYRSRTQAMQRALGRPLSGPLRSRVFIRSSRLAGRVGAALGCMGALESAYCAAAAARPEVRRYRELFSEIQPAAVFCGSQRPTTVLPAVLAAKEMGIPTVAFVFSWDHLTTKGRIAAPFDHYLVWSRHMRGELMRYYPQIPADRIHIVGTPQFDPYADRSLLWSRDEFCRRIGADPARKLLCYSGGDLATCPEDPQHLEAVAEDVRTGRILGNPHVLLRPVPVDNGKRYDAVCSRYPEIIRLQPQWLHAEPGNWTRVLPTAEDVQFLTNLTHHVDVNLNLGSTMTLDFGLHDKPVVNVAFDCSNPPVFGMPVWEYYYRYEHLRPVVDLGTTRIARTREQLAGHVNAYLENPALDRDGRRRLVELQVDVPPGESSRRIVEVMEELSGCHVACA
jgi:hypothetical protein